MFTCLNLSPLQLYALSNSDIHSCGIVLISNSDIHSRRIVLFCNSDIIYYVLMTHEYLIELILLFILGLFVNCFAV